MKYNLSRIMLKAWKIYRDKKQIGFGESLHRAWLSVKAEVINARRIETAKRAAGVKEESHTWHGWKRKGYTVLHNSKALFACCLIWAAKGDGAIYKASFFGQSQVQRIPAV